MAHDGSCRDLHAGQGLGARAGFILAPYKAEERSSFIPEERDTLPQVAAFKPMQHSLNKGHTITSREEYHERFTQFITCLNNSDLDKIVLARCEDIPCEHFSPSLAFARACELYPDAFNALFHSPQSGTWICSTPELLIKGSQRDWTSMSLAGTQQRGGKWSDKNIREQECVSEHTRTTLRDLNLPYVEAEPTTLSVGEIEHLCSLFRIDMQAQDLDNFLREFPPTPAVCGYPTQLARNYLKSYPDIDRKYYAGFVGPYHTAGESSIYVTLRCMELAGDGRCCRLYAGGGVLAESDEESEWQETCLKMQAMRRLIEEQLAAPQDRS